MTAHDAYRVVSEAHLHTIRLAEYRTGVENQFAIHLWLCHLTLNLKLSFGTPIEAKKLVGNKAVEYFQGQFLSFKGRVYGASLTLIIHSIEITNLPVVLIEETIHLVGTVDRWRIDELRTDIAHGTALIDHVLHRDRARNRKLFLGLDGMEVSVHDSLNIGRVGQNAERFFQIETMQGERQVLQGRGVFIIREELHTLAIGG